MASAAARHRSSGGPNYKLGPHQKPGVHRAAVQPLKPTTPVGWLPHSLSDDNRVGFTASQAQVLTAQLAVQVFQQRATLTILATQSSRRVFRPAVSFLDLS